MAGNTLAATLCYICAGNIDKTVEIWSRSLQTDHEGKSYVDLLQVRQYSYHNFDINSQDYRYWGWKINRSLYVRI